MHPHADERLTAVARNDVEPCRRARDCAHASADSSAYAEGTDLHRRGAASRCDRRRALAAIRDVQRRATNVLTSARGFCAVRSGTRLPCRVGRRMRPPPAAGANHHARLWPGRCRDRGPRTESEPATRGSLDTASELANPANRLASPRRMVAPTGLAATAPRLAVVATAALVLRRHPTGQTAHTRQPQWRRSGSGQTSPVKSRRARGGSAFRDLEWRSTAWSAPGAVARFASRPRFSECEDYAPRYREQPSCE